MTSKVSDCKNVIHFKDNPNDIKRRAMLLAIPLLRLYHPFRRPISLSMGVLRAWRFSSQFYHGEKKPKEIAHNFVHTTLAVTALVGKVCNTYWSAPLAGMQNLLLATQHLMQREVTLKSGAKVANQVLYLALLLRGGLTLSISVLTSQLLVHLNSSGEEFKKGRALEGCSHLLTGTMRAQQLYTQGAQLKNILESYAIFQK